MPVGPSGTLRPYLIVETNNSGPISAQSQPHIQPASELARNGLGGSVAQALRLPLLMPIFPRDSDLYTHSLGRSTLLTEHALLRRLDLQLLAMSRNAIGRLRSQGVAAQDKLLLTGFSASAMFATRLALLHPQAVQAVAAGGLNGFVILPHEQLSGQALRYPLGTSDLQAVAGTDFDAAGCLRLPQFLFMGELDTNDAVDLDDSYDDVDRQVIHSRVGKRMMPDRWQACEQLYALAGASARFLTYAGIGHGTNGRIHREVADFLRSATSWSVPPSAERKPEELRRPRNAWAYPPSTALS